MRNITKVLTFLILGSVLLCPGMKIMDTPLLGEGDALAFINFSGSKDEPTLKDTIDSINPKDKLITQDKELIVQKGKGEKYIVKLKEIGKNSIVINLKTGDGKDVNILRRVLLMPSFKDVNEDHWAKAQIEVAVAAGLINKQMSTYFRPDGTLSREKFARSLVKALDLKPVSVTKDVSKDIPASSNYAKHINYLVNTRKIMDLDANGNFRPEDKITRGEAINAICKLEGLIEDKAMFESPFEDLPPRHKYAKIISTAKKEGLLKFAEKRGMLDADGLLTNAEFAVIMTKTELGKRLVAELFNWEVGYSKHVDKRNIVALTK